MGRRRAAAFRRAAIVRGERRYYAAKERLWRRRAGSETSSGRTPGVRHVVAIFETWRAYGGPEEGGWWYDAGDLISIDSTFYRRDRAFARALTLNAQYRRPATYDRSWTEAKVISQPEGWPVPAYFPRSRPRYE